MTDDMLRAELDRVGASYEKAGAARFIQAKELGDETWLLGEARRTWRGPTFDVLSVLATLRHNEGPDAIWKALGIAA